MTLVPDAAVAADGRAAELPDRAALDPPARVLFPDDGPDDPVAGRVAAGGARAGRWGRRAAYGVVSLLAAAAVPAWYFILVSHAVFAPAPAPAPAPAAPARAGPQSGAPSAQLDPAADTLGLAVAAFDLRAELFARRQVGCSELAAGLVAVEERWLLYNDARRNASVLDTARDVRDRLLYAHVDAVERRFEQSRCPRP
jgi:hypothetical protein